MTQQTNSTIESALCRTLCNTILGSVWSSHKIMWSTIDPRVVVHIPCVLVAVYQDSSSIISYELVENYSDLVHNLLKIEGTLICRVYTQESARKDNNKIINLHPCSIYTCKIYQLFVHEPNIISHIFLTVLKILGSLVFLKSTFYRLILLFNKVGGALT